MKTFKEFLIEVKYWKIKPKYIQVDKIRRRWSHKEDLVGLDQKHYIARMVKTIKAKNKEEQLPPIFVTKKKMGKYSYYALRDGHHRHTAHKLAGRKRIKAQVED